MKISFSSNSITNDHIAKKFGTCHDSPAVVPCAKYCSDHFISIWMRAKWNFHHIWIVMEKLLVKFSTKSIFSKFWTEIDIFEIFDKNRIFLKFWTEIEIFEILDRNPKFFDRNWDFRNFGPKLKFFENFDRNQDFLNFRSNSKFFEKFSTKSSFSKFWTDIKTFLTEIEIF